MGDNGDKAGCGCGCGLTILIIGLAVMWWFHFTHSYATSLEQFLFFTSVTLGTLAIAAIVIYAIADPYDGSHDGKGGGCLTFFIGSDDDHGGNPSSYNYQNTDGSSDSGKYINLGTVITPQPTVQTGGAPSSDSGNNTPDKNSSKDSNYNKGNGNNSSGGTPKPRVFIESTVFDKLKSSVNNLYDFCYEQAGDKDLRDYLVGLSENGTVSLTNNVQNICNLLYTLAMKDVFTCIGNMGHHVGDLSTTTFLRGGKSREDIDCKKLEGQMLFAMMYVEENRYASYTDFKSVVMQAISGKQPHDLDVAGENLHRYRTSDATVSCDTVKDYQLALVFGSVSMNDEQKRYKQILYSIVKCFALADGILSDREESVLHELGSDAGVVEVGVTVDGAPDKSIEDLNSLIGLNEVKQSITSLVNFIKTNQKRKSMGMRVPSISYHCVFTGNPGTGKTTVARILAGIYKSLGILKTGQLIETDRSGLVAEYVGQTAVKTNNIIDKAIGGVLFIDEAYSLVGGGKEDYGKEAIATLLKRMEDERDKLVVILAGYSDEMEEFINSNPGLRSRFSRYIHFPDYSVEELYKIFLLNMQKFDYRLTPDAETYLKNVLKDKVEHKTKDFGNAREVRNLFEKAVEAQSDRLQTVKDLTKETMSELTAEDIERASKV